MMANANLLFYMNLSGEVFYIIAHRMKSQSVKLELQQRVFNDLAICICHSTVVQNILKGSLQLLEMCMADIRVLMDRIVHSSIMTVNTYSMEKLFELCLIATRYQFTVCQYPTDILLIALNHLDGIRSSITDTTAIQLCENLHKSVVERLRGESSMMMQEYRYSILTYLADVKLKMTNLIKLTFQKSTGEFVKEFPDTNSRKEFKTPGLIELFERNHLDRSDSSHSSDSNQETSIPEENFGMNDDLEDETDNNYNELYEHYGQFGEEDGCHFENITLQIHDNELQEDDELLEIEYVENSFQEILEHPKSVAAAQNTVIVKFRKNSVSEEDTREPFVPSFDLYGDRGTNLGQSIFEIPGNSDEEALKSEASVTENKLQETDLDAVAVKAVHGLELCSIMLNSSSDQNYKIPLTNFRQGDDTSFGSDDKIPFENASSKACSSLSSKSTMTGINVVSFDARTDRSQSKAALRKISKELDLEELNDLGKCSEQKKGETETNLYNIFDDD